MEIVSKTVRDQLEEVMRRKGQTVRLHGSIFDGDLDAKEIIDVAGDIAREMLCPTRGCSLEVRKEGHVIVWELPDPLNSMRHKWK